jgi:hypothetical protein
MASLAEMPDDDSPMRNIMGSSGVVRSGIAVGNREAGEKIDLWSNKPP